MKKVLIILLLLTFDITFCQNILIEGIVKNNHFENLEYVNIGVKKKNIGTISNERGEFSINLDKIYLNDSLTFSYMGYKNLTLGINDLLSSPQKEIQLKNTEFELDQTTGIYKILVD